MEPSNNLDQFSIGVSDTAILILKEKVLLQKSSPEGALVLNFNPSTLYF